MVTSLYGPTSTLVALERAVRATGYPPSLVTTLEGQAGIARGVEALLSQGVDGIVVAAPVDEGEGPRLDHPTATARDGRRARFVHNWSFNDVASCWTTRSSTCSATST